MPEASQCAECGAALPPNWPRGLCSPCALKGALELTPFVTADLGGIQPRASVTEQPGDRIGRYKLLEKIGEGGCGVVYMAKQEEPVRRRVALKVIKPGMDTHEVIARFEAERQALALMEHPHIAKVFDGGATDAGRPYFVMELVRGLRITDYCDQKNLSTRQRLDLFMQVCQAVQHAHQKGIIHRDLKPSNILVTVNDGVPVPKVIDFGIAKATGQRLTDKTFFTAFQQIIGTPAYMSPEQAEMTSVDIDTRSDIYSLGVLLYELLTGRTPFDAKELLRSGVEEMLRTIREQEPVRPSTRLSTLVATEQTTVAQRRQTEPAKLTDILRGDLDWIVMKALEKDRARRYETANGLAMDIQRHLNDEPVSAGPPGQLYRFGKLVRRYKLAFAAASAIVATLLLGLGLSSWQYFEKNRAYSRALEAEQEQSRLREAAEKNAQGEARQRMEAEQLVTRLEIRTATELLAADDAPAALAALAQVLRKAPDNRAAAEALLSAMTQQGFPLPAFPPLKHDARVTSAEFSPDGRWIVSTAGREARLWDARSGQPVGPPLVHTGAVVMAQFSPDGRLVVTGSADKTARVWDVATGRSIGPSLVHTAAVNWVEFSPDGRWLVTASDDKTAQVWNVLEGTARGRVASHRAAVNQARFSPDGRSIVTASKDATARVWSAETGEALTTALKHGGEVYTAEFSPDGQAIVTACVDGKARVWDAQSGRLQIDRLVHRGEADRLVNRGAAILVARFSPDGQRILTAGDDHSARVWDAVTGQPITPLLKHRGHLRDARFSLDGQRVVTASFDRTARVWDVGTGRPQSERLWHEGEVTGASFSSRGNFVLTFSKDQSVRVWRLQPAQPLGPILPHDDTVYGCDISPDGSCLATASWDRTAGIWDAQKGIRLTGPLQHANWVGCVQFSPDGQRVVTGSRDNIATIWNAHTGERLVRLVGHANYVRFVQFSPDGRSVLSTSPDGTARVWDAATGKLRFNPIRHRSTVWTASFSPDGSLVATAAWDNTARLWDARTGAPRSPPLTHGDRVHTARFSPDGQWLVTASNDQTARVWDTKTGQETVAPLKHESSVHTAEFSPDGKWIVTASDDWTARVWDARTARPIARLTGHEGNVLWAKFSPDGRRVITASTDKTARVWDGLTGQPLGQALLHGGGVNNVCFSSNGLWVLTASDDRTARLWEIPQVTGPVPEWLPTFAEALAGQRLDAAGLPQSVPFEELVTLQEQVRRDASDDACSRWVNWFLNEDLDRAMSPSSSLTIEGYVQQRIAQNTVDSLQDAMRLSPNNGLALARLARLLLKQATNDSPGTPALAEGYSRVAVALAPGEAEAWWARAEVFEQAGDLPQALAAMRRGGELAPKNPPFWSALGRLLERGKEIEEALMAYSTAVTLAASLTNGPNSMRQVTLLKRRTFLARQNRPEAAQKDFLLAWNIPARNPATPARCVDLTAHYTTQLEHAWLGALPTGRQTFGDIEFDVRGSVQLRGSQSLNSEYPGQSTGIAVGQRCRRLHFLHGAVGGNPTHNAPVGSYVIHYADGEAIEIPLRLNEDFLHWRQPRPPDALKNATLAWRGKTPANEDWQLWKLAWNNSRPDSEIVHLDFRSTQQHCSPFLIAITAEP